jgi:zinc transport system substrate-binding protein
VKEVANQICEVVQTIDTLNMQYYFTNTENFIKLLDSFHNELKSKLLPIKNKPIITAHNSFGYFIKEFQLTYGDCLEESPDKEITSKHFKEIVSKIKELKIKTIFSEKQINPQLINSVANNADVKVGILDPLGADKKIKTYFDLINWNANVMLKEL